MARTLSIYRTPPPGTEFFNSLLVETTLLVRGRDRNPIRHAPAGRPASDAAFITVLLKQRRHSLMFEGGHRWIDARRFNRLNDLPLDQPTQSASRRSRSRSRSVRRGTRPRPATRGGGSG
jgi:hypothetical protein